MHRQLFKQDGQLTDAELEELADTLAMQLHAWLGNRVYRLHRSDIADLIESYTNDLAANDQRTVCWMIWHLFQDAREMHRHGA